MRSRFALLAFIGLAILSVGQAWAESPAKVDNVLARPLAADREAFVDAALRAPARGSCEVVSPDPGFVEEMLLDVSSIGAAGERKYERRVALVVGNGAYREPISSLANPPNDASSMAKMFRALGFTVYRAVDATEKSLDDCFARFRGDLEASDAAGAKADIALFFYAGHGVQLTSTADNEKRNYMLSVDAAVDPATGKAKGFRQIDRVLTEMRAHSKQAIFLYDACRNAPYGEGAVKEADGQSVRASDASFGAAPVAEETERASQAGLFIAYATSPGKTADDAWGPQGSTHSPFTEALLKNLPTPGTVIEEALTDAYFDVRTLTQGRQTPWTSSSLTERVRLNGALDADSATVSSAEFAARSANLRERGLKGQAIAEALKGQPAKWSAEGATAIPHAQARAEVFRAFDSKHVAFPLTHGGASAALSPDGRCVVTKSAGVVAIWSAVTGARQSSFKVGDFEGSVSLNADCSQGVTAGAYHTEARIWDLTDGALLATLKGHEADVNSAVFSADGARVITASQDKTAKIWDARTGALLKTLEGHLGGVSSVAFSRDGFRAMTGSWDGVKIWDSKKGQLLRTLAADEKVADANFSADGARVVTASGRTAKIWDAASGVLIGEIDDYIGRGHASYVGSAAFSEDRTKVVTASGDETAKVWDVRERNSKDWYDIPSRLLRTLRMDDSVQSAEFSRDGRRILTASGDRVRTWDADGSALVSLASEEGGDPVYDVAYRADGVQVVTANDRGGAIIWDVATSLKLKTLGRDGDGVLSVAFGPDGTRVITGSRDGAVKVWKAATGEVLMTLAGHEGRVESVAVSADGARIASGSNDTTARIWNAGSGALLNHIKGHQGYVSSVDFEPSGDRIATAADLVRISDANTGALVLTLPRHGESEFVSSARFSPDGRYLVSAALSDPAARIWDSASGALAAEFAGQMDGNHSAAFNANGAQIVTGGVDGIARTWDAKTGAILKSFEGHRGDVVAATFSPDGSRVVTASQDGAAIVWDAGLYGPDLLEAAYALLTDEQRAEVERERIRYWEVAPELLQ